MPETTDVIDAATSVMSIPIQYLVCAAWFAGFFLASRLFKHWIGPRLARAAKHLERPYVSAILQGYLRPCAALIALAGLYIGVRLLPFEFLSTPEWRGALLHLVRVCLILLGAWGALNTFAFVPRTIADPESPVTHTLGATASRFLERVCKALIGFFAVVLIINELGFNVTSLITGLGLGGLTFALAAQDTAGNLFGGLVILFEKPFGIGDWISTPTVEGTVEDMTFRSTKIRTLGNAPTLVPNSKICAEPITNWSRLNMRLANFTLSLTYSTPRSVLTAVTQDIRAMLAAHPDVLSDTVQVRLLDFSENSLDIFIFFYVNTTSIVDYRVIREDINLRILAIMEQHSAHFALPSRTVYFSDTPPRP